MARKKYPDEIEALMDKLIIYDFDDPADLPEGEDIDEEIQYDLQGNVIGHWIKGKPVTDLEE